MVQSLVYFGVLVWRTLYGLNLTNNDKKTKANISIYTQLYRAYIKFAHILYLRVPRTNTRGKKNFISNMSANVVFDAESKNFSPQPQFSKFLSVGTFYSGPISNKETLHKRIFDACHTIRNHCGTSERVGQCVIRRVHACFDSGGECFEHLL